MVGKHRKKHRFSFLITPISFVVDTLILFTTFYVAFKLAPSHIFPMVFYWFVLSFFTDYYGVTRHTSYNELLNTFFKHAFIYFVSVVAYLKVFDAEHLSDKRLLLILAAAMMLMLLFKTLYFLLLKKYRSKGYNQRNYVIFGYNKELKKLKSLLDERVDYGFRFAGYFADTKTREENISGRFEDGLKYIKDEANEVDFVFVSLKAWTDEQIDRLVSECEEAFINLKFVPDNKDILKKKLRVEYFEYYPILSIRKSPLDDPFNAFVKRSFDIFFSLLVVIFILSWLMPLMYILIKIESPGPMLFKQIRNGLNYQPFYCYKFRSMRPNKESDLKQVSKNDSRVTKIGKILRKTSIDELPQFINVLKGDMSVVGPRPHMVAENERFRKRVNKFLGRHYVKPGITGLAQVKGYRGEVVTDDDIINRLKYDMYYIENWSIFLDLKIIFQTVINILKGDEKAY